MDRQERIELVCQVADENGLDRAEFLGGGFAESGINLDRWERYGEWPDVSFGMYQQTVAFADEGDHSASPENIQFIKDLYFDPWHAARVAAVKFKAYRAGESTALDAWCRYNWPSQNPLKNPNRGNYEWGLGKAVEELSGAPSGDRTFGPDVPDEIILQQDDWSCSVRSSYAALWVKAQVTDQKAMDYATWQGILVPAYVTPRDGLLDASGAGLVKAFGSVGVDAQSKNYVTLSEIQEKAGKQPLLIGGRSWYHWVYVRGVESDGTLILENPSPGYLNIRYQLRDSFGRLGPFSMVWINMPPVVPPEPPRFEFHFGFLDKANELGHDIVGDPLEDEHELYGRYNVQLTSTGMMVYSKQFNENTFIRG